MIPIANRDASMFSGAPIVAFSRNAAEALVPDCLSSNACADALDVLAPMIASRASRPAGQRWPTSYALVADARVELQLMWRWRDQGWTVHVARPPGSWS